MTFLSDFSKFRDRVALVEGNRSITYQQLHSRGVKFSNRIKDEKSLILLGIDNSIDSIIAYCGAVSANHVVILYDNNNTLLRDSLAQSFRPNYLYHKQGLDWEIESLDQGVSADELHPDLALMLSTSGSTGSGKCVRLSKKNLLANAESISEYLSINHVDNSALLLPAHYSYGLSVLNSHLIKGACLHVGDISVASAGFAGFLRENSITSFAGVPYTFEILERSGFRSEDFPDLNYITQAGGRLAPDKVIAYSEWAQASGKKFFVMYGQTEATARIAYMPPELLKDNAGSIGKVIPGGRMWIKDENGSLTESANVTGELVYQGQNVMMGYASNYRELKDGYEHDFLYTGDIAVKGETGLFSIIGRLKRFAKIYGKRFNLDEIEAGLQKKDYTVYCVSDDNNLYVCHEGSIIDDLAGIIQATYGIAPKNIFQIPFDKYPLLASGKIDYSSLLKASVEKVKKDIREENSNPYKYSVNLVETYQQYFKNVEVNDSDSFSSLGGDSLIYVSLSIELEKILGRLPKDWTKTSIKNLGNCNAVNTDKSKKMFPVVDTVILLRVLAVLAVVSNHAGFTIVRGGAVALLILAGFSYFRFQFQSQLSSSPYKILPSLILNVLIPYWFMIIAFSLIKQVDINFYHVFLIGNNMTSDSLYFPFGTWFIQAMMQSILLFTIPVLIPILRRKIQENLFFYAFSWLIIACVLRVLDAYFAWGKNLGLSGEQLSWCLWVFALGACVASADGMKEKYLVSLVGFGLPLAFYWGDHSRVLAGIMVVYMILWVNSLFIPGLFLPLIKLLGAASMFVYILHPRAPIDIVGSGLDLDVLRVVIGVILGVVGYLSYNFGLSIILRVYNKQRFYLRKIL